MARAQRISLGTTAATELEVAAASADAYLSVLASEEACVPRRPTWIVSKSRERRPHAGDQPVAAGRGPVPSRGRTGDRAKSALQAQETADIARASLAEAIGLPTATIDVVPGP